MIHKRWNCWYFEWGKYRVGIFRWILWWQGKINKLYYVMDKEDHFNFRFLLFAFAFRRN